MPKITVTVAGGTPNQVISTLDYTISSGGITHGSQLSATSDAAADMIGPRGPLTPMPGRTFIDGEVIENAEISGQAKIAAGAHVTFRNSRFCGWPSQESYTIRVTYGDGCLVELEDCEVIARTLTSSTPRCLTMWGDGSARATRTIFRGGVDNIYVNPSRSAGRVVTGDLLVPRARVLLEDCWFGDIQRVPGSHSDGIQIDGGGWTVIRRCRIMGFSLPSGADPATDRITDPARADLAGGPIICTQNSSNPNLISHVAIQDCWIDGGNITVGMGDAGAPSHLIGCRFGLRHRYGPLNLGGEVTAVNNTWGQTGTTTKGVQVVAGQPVRG